jgi:glucans biosynthesis protein
MGPSPSTDNVEPCGARTRDGGVCRKPPTEGKSRCFSHGGGPRSGAPRGNKNARKSGRYVDGGDTRRTLRKTTKPLRDMQKLAHATLGAPVAAGQTTWSPRLLEVVRNEVLREATKAEADLLRRRPRDTPAYHSALAARDALRLLCQERGCFASERSFKYAVCRTFLAIEQGRWSSCPPMALRESSYHIAWRVFCTDLYDSFRWSDKKSRQQS